MRKENVVFCIDLKSFYASVECASRNLDPFFTNLVVADVSRGPGSVVLAVSPSLKKLGIPSRGRIYELPDNLPIIFAKPRMQLYIDVSIQILKIYLHYFSVDDMHIYSIDEVFIDYTPYQKLYKKTPLEFSSFLLKEIFLQTKITATCGIGNNMFIAKVAMDFEAKHSPENIAYWKKEDVQKKLEQITDLTAVWGIGKRIAKRLSQLGIYNMKDLAQASLSLLEKEFGIIGIELSLHAHGIDEAIIQQKGKTMAKSIRVGQTLDKDYHGQEIIVIIQEMVEDICYRLRKENVIGNTVHLSMSYSYEEINRGFSRQSRLEKDTDEENIIYQEILFLFHKFYQNEKIRKISISIRNLTKKQYIYPNLFFSNEDIEKEEKLNQVIDEIKKRFQKNIIFKASALLEESTYLKRTKFIGGHNAK